MRWSRSGTARVTEWSTRTNARHPGYCWYMTVETQRAAMIQTLLEGVPLPAARDELVAYARREDERAAAELEAITDREYRSLDEVGEALAPVQPARPRKMPEVPREESDLPPGGDDYTRPHPEPGAVRPSAPASNPPQKALEQQTKTQQQQKQRQEQLGA